MAAMHGLEAQLLRRRTKLTQLLSHNEINCAFCRAYYLNTQHPLWLVTAVYWVRSTSALYHALWRIEHSIKTTNFALWLKCCPLWTFRVCLWIGCRQRLNPSKSNNPVNQSNVIWAISFFSLSLHMQKQCARRSRHSSTNHPKAWNVAASKILLRFIACCCFTGKEGTWHKKKG
jgi:hypothetical protein